ncbi:MAG: succinate dehydrogenase, cytochrome b556 subunit [Alcanivoracaceae bacterium]|nr:succinate dehydrogenase, cytochrome b556 subunit [Alcanivoracaceae bacterium]
MMATVNQKRPVNLDLTTIKFPVTAIVSIFHRMTGVAIFFAIPVLLWLLDRSLASPESFADVKELMTSKLAVLVMWGILAVLIYHFLAGVRHLVMDMGIGETLEGGRRGAFMVFIGAAILIFLAGGWLW